MSTTGEAIGMIDEQTLGPSAYEIGNEQGSFPSLCV
jgi:hypothetical protein